MCGVSKEKIKEEVLDIYTPFSVAKEEIWKRWNDKALRKKVEEFLGGEIPEPFKNGPRAVFSRQVTSPNTEFRYFYSLAKEIGLKPLCLEGTIDKFCTTNPEKAALGKMEFVSEDRNGNISDISYLKIVDFKEAEGKKICDIKTSWGENFVDFHHRMLGELFPKVEIFDDFVWFKKRGYSIKAEDYYRNYLTFFLCFGVLFENFSLHRNEISFTHNVVRPNFNKIAQEFGIKPLVVPLIFLDDEAHVFWRCYPNSLKKTVEDSLKK